MTSAVTVVADDLTGANATGALFARMGMRTRTLTSSSYVRGGQAADAVEEADVTVVTTGSRVLSAGEAARGIRRLLDRAPALAGSPVLAKRVDTTLRGPIAAELAEVLEHRRRHRRAAALAVPAYPSAGRTTVGGLHLLHGRPLAETPAGRDPLTPVAGSRVADLMTVGTGLTATELHLDTLRAGVDEASAAIAQALTSADVTVLDAATDEDLTRLAAAAARARERAGIDVVPVDSGPFVAAFCAALGILPRRPEAPVLVVVGSTAEPTTAQVAQARRSLELHVLPVETGTSAEELAGSTVRALESTRRDVCWKVVPPAQGVDARLAAKIPHWLASAARLVMEETDVGGVFACGGEVAAAVLDALGVHSLEIEGEVQPLVVAGRLRGGAWDRLPVVTKGGMVGDDRAVSDSIGRLHEMHQRLFGTVEERRTTPR